MQSPERTAATRNIMSQHHQPSRSDRPTVGNRFRRRLLAPVADDSISTPAMTSSRPPPPQSWFAPMARPLSPLPYQHPRILDESPFVARVPPPAVSAPPSNPQPAVEIPSSVESPAPSSSRALLVLSQSRRDEIDRALYYTRAHCLSSPNVDDDDEGPLFHVADLPCEIGTGIRPAPAASTPPPNAVPGGAATSASTAGGGNNALVAEVERTRQPNSDASASRPGGTAAPSQEVANAAGTSQDLPVFELAPEVVRRREQKNNTGCCTIQ